MLECGPQATGGTFTDWDTVPDWHNIGYPIAECHDDGSFVVSKPDGTGGLIIPGVIAEQALYEIGDPASYLLPDVAADFSNVRLTQVGPDMVRVEGARGRPPTGTYKVSATYQDGYRAVATVSIVGIDAARKAERTGEAMIARARMSFAKRGLPDFVATHIEALGAEASYGTTSAAPRIAGGVASARGATSQPRGAGHLRARNRLGRAELRAPARPASIPGVPKPTPVVQLFTFYLEKSALGRPRMQIGDAPAADGRDTVRRWLRAAQAEQPRLDRGHPGRPYRQFAAVASRLCAFRRQGQFLERRDHRPQARIRAAAARREVTPERMVAQLGHLVGGPAERFEAPGLHAHQFSDRRCTGRRGEWPPSGSTRKARRTARWRWR